jgi:AP-4 complex subunit epsilon-1
MVIHRCIQRSADVAHEVNEALRRALCDRDPSVMASSLHCFALLLKQHLTDHPTGEVKLFRELVPSFVSIMKQIIEHRLDKEFEYHKTPAPWIQTHILRILAILGRESPSASEHMYEILHETMRRADTGMNAGYAVTYEAVRTICSIHPNKPLLDQAAEAISQFIASPNNNLKYMGLTLLAQIVQINPAYAVQHQMHVIQCLEDPDESIQRKTLTLLYKMTNPRNVMIVADKLLEYLKKSADVYLRSELVSKITSLAERYSVNNEWFIKTMSRVFLLGGDLVQPEVAFNLMRLIAEGVGESQDADDELRLYAVESYLDLAQKPNLPDILVQVIAWVLGEYGYLLGGSQSSNDTVMDALADLMERSDHKSSETRLWCAAALAKATAILRGGLLRHDVQILLLKYQGSDNIELSRRCQEYLTLFSSSAPMQPEIVESILPRDASCEDLNVQEYIGHIVDSAVSQALAEGGQRFIPLHERGGRRIATTTVAPDASKKGGKGLRFDQYAAPAVASPAVTLIPASAAAIAQHNDAVLSQATAPVATPAAVATKQNLMEVAGPWSKSGFGQGLKAAPKLPQADAAAPASGAGYQSPSLPAASNPGSQSAAPRPATPKKPLIDEKTQKLANDLFQGLGGDDGGDVPSGVRRVGSSGRPNRQPAAAAPVIASQSPLVASSSSGDLLSGLTLADSSSSSPTTSTTSSPMSTNPTPSKPVDLLLDLDFGASAAAAPTTSSPTSTNPTNSFGFLDESSGLSSSPLSTNNTSKTLSPAAGDVASVLRPTAAPISTVVSYAKQLSNMNADNFDVNNLSASDALTSYIKGQTLAGPQANLITGDSHLSVSYLKVWAQDEIHACIVVGNKFPKDLAKVDLSLTAPTGAAFAVAGVAGDGQFDSSNGTVTIQNLPSRQAALVVVRIQYCGRLEHQCGLQAQIVFQVSQTQSKNLKITIPLTAADFLRPVGASSLSVQRYGQLWPQHKQENKFRVAPSNAESMEELEKRLSACNIAIIQVIKTEAVAAGRLLPNKTSTTPSPNAEGALGELCLFHFKLEAGKALSVQVRSKDKMITDNAARHLNIALAGSN